MQARSTGTVRGRCVDHTLRSFDRFAPGRCLSGPAWTIEPMSHPNPARSRALRAPQPALVPSDACQLERAVFPIPAAPSITTAAPVPAYAESRRAQMHSS
jgi:hypothetical protein